MAPVYERAPGRVPDAAARARSTAGRQRGERRVDVGLGRGAPEREPKDLARLGIRPPQRQDDVRRLGDAGLARGAGRHGDAALVEEEQQRLAARAGEEDVRVAWQPALGAAEELGAVDGGQDAAHQPVAQPRESHGLGIQLGDGELGGRRERRGTGDVLRARPQPALLAAAVHEGCEGRLARDDERADTGRPADLVGRDAQRDQARGACGIRSPLGERDRNMAEGRDGVEVQGDPAPGRGEREARRVVDRSDFVVRDERGGERRTAQRLGERLSGDRAERVECDGAHLGAIARDEPPDGVDGRVVLAVGQDDGV